MLVYFVPPQISTRSLKIFQSQKRKNPITPNFAKPHLKITKQLARSFPLGSLDWRKKKEMRSLNNGLRSEQHVQLIGDNKNTEGFATGSNIFNCWNASNIFKCCRRKWPKVVMIAESRLGWAGSSQGQAGLRAALAHAALPNCTSVVKRSRWIMLTLKDL